MTATITAATTILVAIIGFLFTYLHTRRLQERNDRLARVNRQLGELYGPAFAISDSTRIGFEAFCAKYDDVRRFKDEQDRLPAEQREAWKAWILTVFQPANKRVFELLMAKADLLVDDVMPPCISEFCSHVASYDVVIAEWENGAANLFAVIDYPPEFTDHIRHSYGLLKKRQAVLLGEGRTDRFRLGVR
ncbi:hypothetical protein [Streptomyces sp. NBC_01538]|uniref:hypothetical protein n=1 Tax=Streptomyces sp. NBC_01538 TaxID=2903897 RepID=UPI00386D2073